MSTQPPPHLTFGKYAFKPITKVPTPYLKWFRENVEGSDPIVEDEWQKREQYVVRLLRPLPPPYDEKRCRRIFAEARQRQRQAERAERKRKRRRRKKERQQEARDNWRQNQIAITERVKAGFVVVGADFDPSRCDGSCPF